MKSRAELFGHPLHPMLIPFPLGLPGMAAVFGAIDRLAIPSGTRAKRIGAAHGLGNVVIVVLFAGAWPLRRGEPEDPSGRAVLIEVAGVPSLGPAQHGQE